jgi:hypothetical protein
MYGALPKIEKSFEIDHKGSVTGIEYKGTFTVRCILNIGQKHVVELEKSRLMADQRNPTPDLIGMAIALAETRGRIIEAPAWWKDSKLATDILDEEVIYEVYNKCLELEEQWKIDIKKNAEEAASKNV